MYMPQQTHAGAVKGEFRIDSDGGAGYSIPVQGPPGPRSITPSVSVGYNSSGGNDLLGVGWGLQGFSSITRSAATVAQDGFTGTVNLDNDDRFALDGQRLIAVEGQHGSANAVYRTEIESWKKVTPIYGANPEKGPISFRVYDRRGTLYEFGTTPDSRLLTPTGDAVRIWHLSRMTDLAGNYQTFLYDPDPTHGVIYPLRLNYGGFKATPPRRSIRIRYESRPDAVSRYTAGFASRVTRRVSNIDSYLDESPVMHYRFAYETGKVTGRSRLLSVTQAGRNGGELSPTHFAWQEGAPHLFGEASTLATAPAFEAGTLLPMDINGDGVVDLVHASTDGDGHLHLDLYLARHGGGFEPRTTMPVTGLPGNARLLPMDVDGDGCIDLVHAFDNDGRLELTILKAAFASGKWTLVPGTRGAAGPAGLRWADNLFSMDVDGDGLPDLVHILEDDGTSTLTTLFSDGTRFAPDPRNKPATSRTLGGYWLSGDFNGDGMGDLLHASEQDGTLALDTFISQGRTGFVRQLGGPKSHPVAMGILIPIDVNGDGKTDLVNAFYNNDRLELTTLVSTGKSFSALPTEFPALPGPANQAVLMPADLNGDGLMDLVLSWSNEEGTTSIGGLISNGAGFTFRGPAAQPLRAYAPAPLLPLDLDGDGRTDLLHVSSDADGNLVLRQVLIAGQYPDLLSSITNGIGGRHEIRYDTMTNPEIYSKQTIAPNTPAVQGVETAGLLNAGVSGATYPLTGSTGPTPGAAYATRITAFPRQLVRSYVRTTGSGQPSEYKYFYRAGRLDVTGRGWLGFESSLMTDVEFDAATLTEYHRNFPLERSPSRVTTSRASDGGLTQRVRYTQEAAPTSPKTWNVRERIVDAEFFSFAQSGSTPDAVRRRTSEYDAWGNLIRLSDSGTGPNAPASYSLETFSPPDLTRWILGRSIEARVSADEAGATILRHEKRTYQELEGQLLTQQTWNDQSASWLVSTSTYDDHGNVIASTDPSGATTKVTFDSEHHAFPMLVESPPNIDGKHIVSRFEFDPCTGEQTTRFHPVLSSNTAAPIPAFSRTFDELGRPIEEHGPDPTGKLVPLLKRTWITVKEGTYQEEQTRANWEGTAWHWHRSWLDGEGRIHRTESLGPDAKRTIAVRRVLDGRGNVREETLPCYEGEVPTRSLSRYDAAGRLIEETNAGSTLRYEYPTTLRTVTLEAHGKPEARKTTTDYIYCGDQRLPARRTTGNTETTSFTYDPLGRLTAASDPIGVVSTARYDSLGRQVFTSVRGPAGTLLERTLAYDDKQRTVTLKQPDGKTVTATSDALKRTLTKSYSDGQKVEFLYDLSPDTCGRVARIRDSAGTNSTYRYDPNGNQIRVESLIEGASYALEQTYGPAGQPLTFRFPDGSVETRTYNTSQQQTAVSLGEINASFDDFTASGTPTQILLGNTLRETRSYHADGQLISQTLAPASGPALARQEFEWNAMGQLSAILDRVAPTNDRHFTYDLSGRLGSATEGAVKTAFEYDGGGNLLVKGNVRYTYDGYCVRNGKASGQDVFAAEYDADGNTKTLVRNGAKRTFTYDAAGRLSSTEGVTCTYDYTGRRLTKKVQNGPTTIYVSPQFEVVLFPSGQVQNTRYVTSAYGLVGAITTVEKNPTGPIETALGIPAPGTSYFHSDHNGSVTLQTSLKGEVITRVQYDPYGKPTVTGADHIRHKFTGKEFDLETSLYYFESRYYDPETGRFLTADDQLGGPEECRDVLNRYAYVINDPLNHTDPSGHSIFGQIADFFSDVKEAFESPLGKKITMGILGGLLIVGGIVATVFAGPAGVGLALLGGTLLGAGLASAAYYATNFDNLEWRDYGIQVGIGAASGLVTAGISSAASAIIARGVAAAAAEFAATGVASLTWAGAGLSRIAVTIVSATISATASSVGTKYLNNLAKGKFGSDVNDGVGSAAAYGAIFGLVGGAASAKASAYFSKTTSVFNYAGEMPVGWNAVEGTVRNKAVSWAPKLFVGIKDLLVAPAVNGLPEW